MTDVVIAGAARTPVGAFLGSLSGVSASHLGAIAIKEALNRAKVLPEEVDEVIMGQILTAGQGQNTARQAAVEAKIPFEKTALQINQLCGSGLRSVAMGMQSIALGETRIVIAGGQENMSLAPHCAQMRNGQKMGSIEFVDTMLKDGLWDHFNGYHMGVTAENVAQKWQISRDQQDEFAYESQKKTKVALEANRFKDEIVPVEIKTRQGDLVVDTDEHPKPDTSLEDLKNFVLLFLSGTVTAGSASGINDGAAAMVLMRAEDCEKRHGADGTYRVMGFGGVDPAVMGGTHSASQQALSKAGWDVSDLDLIEANEAFAAQACAVNKEMAWDIEKVNVNGGAIALGHPVGASGTRVLTTLVFEMARREVRKGLATLCIGGGMGIAMCVERN